MDNLAKPKNRALFLVSVAVTGAFAGAAVWLFFFAMEHGIDYLWTEIPHEKLTGTKTDDLNQVMAKVKQDGRYPYDNLGKLRSRHCCRCCLVEALDRRPA